MRAFDKLFTVLFCTVLAGTAACPIVVQGPPTEEGGDDGNDDDNDNDDDDNDDDNDDGGDDNDPRDDDDDNDNPRDDDDNNNPPPPDDEEEPRDDTGAFCSDNDECNTACLFGFDEDGNQTDFGYCTKPCESFADCPTFWDCEEVGNAVGTFCVQD